MSVVAGRAAEGQPGADRPAGPLQLGELLRAQSGTAAWWTALVHQIDELGDALADHRAAMQGPKGLFADVLRDAPRLAFAVRSLDRELDELAAEAASLRLLSSAAMGAPGGEQRAVAAASRMVERLEAHHRRVRELLHQSYTVVLGESG
jgi:hypothetical protein